MQRVLWWGFAGLISTTSLWAAPPWDAASSTVCWRTSGARIVGSGLRGQTRDGTLVTGYAIEAAVAGSETAPIRNGRFRLEMTAFKPDRDLPGQRAGRWYVQGRWTITEQPGQRDRPRVIRGSLQADLCFDPTSDRKPFAAAVRSPLSRIGDRWFRLDGTLSIAESLDSVMTADQSGAPSPRRVTKREVGK